MNSNNDNKEKAQQEYMAYRKEVEKRMTPVQNLHSYKEIQKSLRDIMKK